MSVCYLSCTCGSFAPCAISIVCLSHICLLLICLLHICLLHICLLHICSLPCLEGVPPCSDLLGDSLFGGSAPMAASHRVLLSKHLQNSWSFYFLEVTRGRLPWLPLLICILPTLCSLPALLSVGTYPPLSTS